MVTHNVKQRNYPYTNGCIYDTEHACDNIASKNFNIWQNENYFKHKNCEIYIISVKTCQCDMHVQSLCVRSAHMTQMNANSSSLRTFPFKPFTTWKWFNPAHTHLNPIPTTSCTSCLQQPSWRGQSWGFPSLFFFLILSSPVWSCIM